MFISIIVIFIISSVLFTLSFCKVASRSDQWEREMFKEVRDETYIRS